MAKKASEVNPEKEKITRTIVAPDGTTTFETTPKAAPTQADIEGAAATRALALGKNTIQGQQNTLAQLGAIERNDPNSLLNMNPVQQQIQKERMMANQKGINDLIASSAEGNPITNESMPSVADMQKSVSDAEKAKTAAENKQLIPAIKNSLEFGLGTVAQGIDLITSGIKLGKSTDVLKAEAAFNDMSAVIDKEIQMVRDGQKSWTEVQKNFEKAADAINRLESTTKGLGLVNVRYWLDHGKEVEAQIIREKEILNVQRQALLTAAEESRLNQARRKLGIGGISDAPIINNEIQ